MPGPNTRAQVRPEAHAQRRNVAPPSDTRESDHAQNCETCGSRAPGSADLWCSSCHGWFHRSCLGTDATAFIGGTFRCPACQLRAAGLEQTPDNLELARRAVQLRAEVLQPASLATYWSGLKRFERFWAQASCSHETRLQPGPSAPLPAEAVSLFVVWAKLRYAPTTILSTVSALRRWHHEKGLQFPSFDVGLCDLLRILERQAKTRTGKTPKAPYPHSLIPLVLAWIDARAMHDAGGAPELRRDGAMLVLGFFALLRKSEL